MLGSIKEWELIQRKPLEYKTWHHPTTNSTLCKTTHLNNKQNKNSDPSHQQTGLPSHSALPVRGKTSKQKLSTNVTLYEAHTYHRTNLKRAKNERKKEFNLLQGKNSTFLEALEKETSGTISKKKKKGREIPHKWRRKLETQKSK